MQPMDVAFQRLWKGLFLCFVNEAHKCKPCPICAKNMSNNLFDGHVKFAIQNFVAKACFPTVSPINSLDHNHCLLRMITFSMSPALFPLHIAANKRYKLVSGVRRAFLYVQKMASLIWHGLRQTWENNIIVSIRDKRGHGMKGPFEIAVHWSWTLSDYIGVDCSVTVNHTWHEACQERGVTSLVTHIS